MRAPTSAAPPGGNGTIKRIGLSGYCALTEKAAKAAAMNATKRMQSSSSPVILKPSHQRGQRAVRRRELLEHREMVAPRHAGRLGSQQLCVVFRLAAQLGQLVCPVGDEEPLVRRSGAVAPRF